MSIESGPGALQYSGTDADQSFPADMCALKTAHLAAQRVERLGVQRRTEAGLLLVLGEEVNVQREAAGTGLAVCQLPNRSSSLVIPPSARPGQPCTDCRHANASHTPRWLSQIRGS
jgi:hypothetical protein